MKQEFGKAVIPASVSIDIDDILYAIEDVIAQKFCDAITDVIDADEAFIEDYTVKVTGTIDGTYSLTYWEGNRFEPPEYDENLNYDSIDKKSIIESFKSIADKDGNINISVNVKELLDKLSEKKVDINYEESETSYYPE